MDGRSHYTVLGISCSATSDEVKKAFKKCALLWHPDRNPNTEAHPDAEEVASEKFKAAVVAYEVLMDVQARRVYDLANGFGYKHDTPRRAASADYDVRRRSSRTQPRNFSTDDLRSSALRKEAMARERQRMADEAKRTRSQRNSYANKDKRLDDELENLRREREREAAAPGASDDRASTPRSGTASEATNDPAAREERESSRQRKFMKDEAEVLARKIKLMELSSRVKAKARENRVKKAQREREREARTSSIEIEAKRREAEERISRLAEERARLQALAGQRKASSSVNRTVPTKKDRAVV